MMPEIYFNKSKNNLDVPYIFIVEGPDDAYFLDAVLHDIGADPNLVSVCLARGKDKFETTLGLILKSHAFTSGRIARYAIIRDADEDVHAAAADVSALLARLSEPQPASGTIADRPDGRKIGLYMFPGIGQSGDLEELCLKTAGANPPVTVASAYIDQSENLGGLVDHRSKRVAQSYLAISSFPLCAGVGWAMARGKFDVKSAALDELKEFLKQFLEI